MEAFIQWLTDSLAAWGYPGLFLSALLAGSIIPFSSEIVMIILIRMGLNPYWCLFWATAGNTLGGMTCYWIGSLGKAEWITRLGIKPEQIEKAKRFLAGRGAWMGFFAFLPYVGEAIGVTLGLMRSNAWITATSMCVGKLLRYALILATFEGAASLLEL